MGELTAADVSTFTGGRLPNDSNTQALLDSALAAARRYCGWTVSPVATVTLTIDGPGGRVLSLPTLRLNSLSAVTEIGVALDVSKLDVSKTKGTVEKFPYGYWTSRAGAITVTMTHGYTESEAADWRRAILRLVDLMDRDEKTERDTPDLIMKRIDDVQYQWAQGIIETDDKLCSMLSPFRILLSP